MIKKSIGSGRGSVYNVLLKALQTGDKYAYEICKEIEEKTNGAYVLKEQSSYSGLRRLEQRNEITSYWVDSALGGRRHYYSLTDKGRQRLESSNFAWEDTRDEIVDNLFEQSEVDKQINTVSQDLENIKASVSNQNQSDIDEIINKTESLVKAENDEVVDNEHIEQIDLQNKDEQIDEQIENVEENKENSVNNQTDLFSIFADYSESNEAEKNNEEKIEEQTFEDDIEETDIDNEELDNQQSQIEENVDKENTENFGFDDNNTEQEKIDNNQNEELEVLNSESEDEENIEDNVGKNENNQMISLFDFSQNHYDEDAKNEDVDQNKNDEYEDNFEDISENDNTESQEQIENINNEENDENQFQNLNDDESIYENINNDANENFEIDETNQDKELFEDITQSNIEESCEVKNQVEEIEQKQDFDEVMKNLQTINNNESEQTENFANNTSDIATLEKNETDIDFYRQMYKSTNNYIDNTYEEKSAYNFFDDYNYKDENLQSETESDEPLLSDNIVEDDKELDLQQNQNFNDISNSDNVDKNENQSVYQNSKTIDYRDIFGDLVSKNEYETSQESFESNVSDNNFETSQQASSNIEQNFEETSSQNIESNNFNENTIQNNEIKTESDFNELNNENSTINDINRTLIFDNKSRLDEMYEMQSAYKNFDDNEYNYQDNYDYQSQNIDTYNNVSFDRKYNNLENKFDVPNYKIRYQQRPQQKRQSRFLLSNKLNLISNLMLCLLLAICNTITLLICKSLESPNFQIVFCDICYFVITAMILFNLIKYIINPTKRTHNLSKNDIIIYASISAIILVLTFMINIWAWLTLKNLSTYFATLVMPIFFSVALLLSHATKKVLSKSPKFYK